MEEHSYRNYAHIEGVLAEDAAILETKKNGQVVGFRVIVREPARENDGSVGTRSETFDVYIGPRNSRFAANLRKGAAVMVDARLRTFSIDVGGIEHRVIKLKAHRVRSLDYSGWKKNNDLLQSEEPDLGD